MVKQTRRLVRYWKPVFARPRRGALIFFYAGLTPTGGAAFYHHHNGDDLPHLHLLAAPAGTPHDYAAVQSPPQGGHAHSQHRDHHHHEQHESGHWHFAAAASATVPLLVLALCWVSFLFSDEVNRAHLLAAQQWARPPPPLYP
ncbi:MAG: hypothetical protein ACLQU2_28895 [Candidatus Binataceae bacterium]